MSKRMFWEEAYEITLGTDLGASELRAARGRRDDGHSDHRQGIVGILCAWMLQQAGISYVLAEAADPLCSGATGNTTAKLTSQHGLIYHKLIQTFGVDRARQYLSANEAVLQNYRALCRHIDCDFEEKSAYVYSLDDREALEAELRALERLGGGAEFADHLPLHVPMAGAVKFSNQAQFHPLKFVSALFKGLHIYEHTPVRELTGTTAVTDRGRIRAKKIIVATHFPFRNKHGSYFLKLYQRRSYVIALEHAANVDGMYIDEAEDGLSFRNHGGILLVGGGHRTGKQGGWRTLRDFAAKHCPHAIEKYHWATQDCMSLDEAPYIGPYSASTSDPYVATGFNKWGNDFLHGIRYDFKRSRSGKEASFCRSIFAFPHDPPPPTGCQWLGSHGQPVGAHYKTLPPPGLRVEVESPGAHLGLPLPRLPLFGGRQAHRRPRYRGSEIVRQWQLFQ